MTVVSPQQYREATDDTTHFWSEIETWLTDAQSLVEDYLRRLLESESRTETLEAQPWQNGGWTVRAALYPSAYPVTVVPAGYQTRFQGRVILAGASAVPWDFIVEPFNDGTQELTLTYTGGYTSATLPATLRAAIIDVARAIGTPPPSTTLSGIPEGASSVTMGDTSITLRAPAEAAGTALDELVAGVTKRLKGWRNRL